MIKNGTYIHLLLNFNRNGSQTYSNNIYEAEIEKFPNESYDESKVLSRQKRCDPCTCLYYDLFTCTCPYGDPCTDESAKKTMDITTVSFTFSDEL